jgi:septin family protein
VSGYYPTYGIPEDLDAGVASWLAEQQGEGEGLDTVYSLFRAIVLCARAASTRVASPSRETSHTCIRYCPKHARAERVKAARASIKAWERRLEKINVDTAERRQHAQQQLDEARAELETAKGKRIVSEATSASDESPTAHEDT